MRDLLRENGLPEPDDVERGRDEIVLRWHEPKVAVVIELRW